MLDIKKEQEKFIERCKNLKGLSDLTIKAYRIDLNQFSHFMRDRNYLNKNDISEYLSVLYRNYKPKSAKRKTACIKTFYKYMETEEIIVNNPFHKITIKHKEPLMLPRTIPLSCIHNILRYAYEKYQTAQTMYQKEAALRNIITIELLFSTGMRVSEVTQLNIQNIDLDEGTIHIMGKGNKERIMCISDKKICDMIHLYLVMRIKTRPYLLVNKLGNRLSQQSIRNMLNEYAEATRAPMHITPHMFRHTFATELHNEDIDIRYIQQFLGHSSITTTQIYTHISTGKAKAILKAKHPRNKMLLPISEILNSNL